MPDWDAVTEEVTGYLQDLIRIDTTNPPGNEIEAARYVAQVLRGAGLEPEITESAPGRGNVTTRVAGGSRPPLLLLSHTDVVAVDAEHWTHPPFGGELHGGQVWGRGALDMKNMVAAELMVMLLLQRERARLNRDVMFAATADEEAGRGDHGAGWLLDHHPEQIDAPFIITEGGGHDIQVGSRRFTSCQIGQKGICRMRVRASGAPGHASVPHADNAVLRLCRAVGRLDGVDLPLHTSQAMGRFIEGIAAGQEAALVTGLQAIQDPDTGEQALRQLSIPAALKEQLHALLRNTASVTMLAAGSGINVIPTEATAWIDGRLAPGQTDESLVDELRVHLGDEVQIVVDQYSPAIAADTETELYRTIVQVMATHDADAPVVPTLSTGGTDAKHIQPRRPDTQIYGFMPLRQGEGEHLGLMHGHDERTSVANLGLATRILYEVVCRFGGAQR